MFDDLLSQEELEGNCPAMVEELELFMSSSDLFDSDEGTVYALTQIIQNRLEKINLELEQKGGVVSAIIQGLMEFNGDALACHHALIKTLLEQKASTVH